LLADGKCVKKAEKFELAFHARSLDLSFDPSAFQCEQSTNIIDHSLNIEDKEFFSVSNVMKK